MAKEAAEDEATPAVVPGYGEADGEAASMAKAAHEEEHGQAGAGAAAPDAEATLVPDAGAVGYGTTETDVKKRIAEATSREAAKTAGDK